MVSSGRASALAVRLEKGVELPAALEKAAADLGLDFCDVTGFGELDRVDLRAAPGADPVTILGPLNLVSLHGRLRRAGDVTLSEFFCTLSRGTETGLQMLGGALVGGEAVFLELAFIPLESAGAVAVNVRAVAPRSEIDEAMAATRSVAKPSPDPGKWADVIAESRRLEREGKAASWQNEDVVVPSRGDIVNHRQFGRCSVVKIDDEHIALRKPEGRVVQLGLAILSFTLTGNSPEGKSEYDVAVRRG